MRASRPLRARQIALMLLCVTWISIGPPRALAQDGGPSVTISGTVFDRNGQALADARIGLAPVLDDYGGYDLRLTAGHIWADPLVTVTTTGDGRYALQAAQGRRWRLLVEHPEHATSTRRLEPLYKDREMQAVALYPTRQLAVRVRAADGTNVAGARVMANTGAAIGDDWPVSWTAAATDETGIARLRVPRRGPWQIEAGADGHAYVKAKHGGASIAEVELPAVSRLDLRLRLSSGEPAMGALVFHPFAGFPLAKTDRKGRVAVFGVPGSRNKLRVLTTEGASLETEVTFPLLHRRSKGQRLELQLLPPYLLPVQVTAPDQLEGLAGAVAWGRDDRVVYGDAQGRLTLTVLATEPRIQLNVIAPHRLLWQERYLPLSVAGGPPLTVGLAPSATLDGTVVDANGLPVEGVVIDVKPADRYCKACSVRQYREGHDARSGADGRFAIGPVPASARLDLVARKAGFATAHINLDPLRAEPEDNRVDVRIATGRIASGTIVDPRGQPVAGASIELVGWRPAHQGTRHHPSAGAAVEARATSDSSGRFALRDLGSGRYDLMARAGGFAPIHIPGIEIDGSEMGRETGALDLGEVRLAPGMRIAGTVVDEDGQPKAGAIVEVVRPGETYVISNGGTWEAVTGADGRFAFTDRAGGAYEVRAWSDGHRVTASGRLETPIESPIVLILRRGAVVEGWILDEDDQAIAGAEVRAIRRRGGRHEVRGTADEQGQFTLAGLEPAEYRLVFTAAGFKSQNRRLHLAGDGPGPIEVKLTRTATVAGRVSWPDGRPAVGASLAVQLIADDGPRSATATTGDSGEFEIERVAIGPSEIVARFGTLETRESIAVTPDTHQVRLTLPPGIAVSGWVRDIDGQAVASARLSLESKSHAGRDPATTSQADGRFKFRNVAPNDYRLEIEHPHYARYRAKTSFKVVNEPVSGIEAKLTPGGTVSGQLENLDLATLSATRVEIFRTVSDGASVSDSVVLDHRGRFRFENVVSGPYRAEAKTDEQLVARTNFVLPDGTEAIEITLEPATGITLRGSVLKAGHGVANALVQAIPEDGSSVAGNTAGDGSFVLERVPEGPASLRVSSLSDTDHLRAIEVREGVEIVVELPTAEIRGQVRDANSGEPLPGVHVRLEPIADTDSASNAKPERGWRSARSDAAGQFALPEVDGGRYRLQGKLSDYESPKIEIEISDGPRHGIDLEMRPHIGLVLRVPPPNDIVAAGIDVAVFDRDGGGRLEATTIGADDDGRVFLPFVPAGDWIVWVHRGQSAWTRQHARVPGQEVAVTFTEGARVCFTIADLAGLDPLGTLFAVLRDAAGQDLPPLLAHEGRIPAFDGQGCIGGLWPGSWTLELRHEDGRTWNATVFVGTGETAQLDLR